MSRPNFLFMISDDHRFNAIHALGNAEVITPTFDALVGSGAAFTQTHIMGSTSPAVCMPSRAMLLTGRSLFHATEPPQENPYHLPAHVRTFPELLRTAGYMTYGIGKWHQRKSAYARAFEGGSSIFFGGMSDHDNVPIQDFDPDGVYGDDRTYSAPKFSTEQFRDAAIDFLQGYQDERPFCLYVAFTAPHDPRTPPPEYAALYDPARIDLPPNFLSEHPFDNGELRIRDELLAPFPRTPEVIQQHIADYYGMISHMDASIGQILHTLEERGFADNTIVVYCADHGLAVGQHGLMGKQNMYDHSMRVPLLMRGPGIPANRRIDARCYLYDVFPTLLELANLPIPPTNEGISLLPLLLGAKTTHRDSLFAAYQPKLMPGEGYQRMVKQGDFKLIEYFVGGTRRTQLFNLSADPHETRDLASDPEGAAIIARLRTLMSAWQREVDDPALVESEFAGD